MAISEEFIDIAENCVDYSARHREAVSSMNSCKSCLNYSSSSFQNKTDSVSLQYFTHIHCPKFLGQSLQRQFFSVPSHLSFLKSIQYLQFILVPTAITNLLFLSYIQLKVYHF